MNVGRLVEDEGSALPNLHRLNQDGGSGEHTPKSKSNQKGEQSHESMQGSRMQRKRNTVVVQHKKRHSILLVPDSHGLPLTSNNSTFASKLPDKGQFEATEVEQTEAPYGSKLDLKFSTHSNNRFIVCVL